MASEKSGKFFVGSIVVFLILFGLVKIILATATDVQKHSVAPESMAGEDVAERIKPVAAVHIGEAPVIVAAAPAAGEETGGRGAQVVTQVCSVCHATGMMSSPKLGDAGAWAPRIAKGVDVLHNHALNGFNMMPARGGRPDLSDDDVIAAVDHMISLAK